MRRSLLTAVGIMALVLAVPSVALAHHGRGHHHHHNSKAHHAQFRFMHIGSPAAAPVTPTAPTTPTTPPAPENAATVASYTGGVLTLTLNDGSTVSGKVTADTRIDCVKATPPPPTGTTTPPTDGSPGDDNGQGDDQSRGDMSQSGQGQDGWQHDEQGGDDNEEEIQGTTEPPCDSSALVAGAIVRFAELRIGPNGTEFESILLVR
jgi:hypothetical protein